MVGKTGEFCEGDKPFSSFKLLETHVLNRHLGIQGKVKQWLKGMKLLLAVFRNTDLLSVIVQKENMSREEKDDCPLFVADELDTGNDGGDESEN
jgi:hypothetical protein